ncbi:NAD(P)-dependent oxidoreductase [Evansella cellulosilytica]|uniref:3-hydroxyisobutyrate dehydrogenase n=1 Tax=Evansella cellulosilytica (strain ATCC 21833 / DSM 2522 / FERM P-1141 / JCM 9156 / N-4) TaxID=649639 RepID=E6TTH0_EVAC2|nr:NAD(P)-dependent oxidoreductase [Evansella cellulosilytica]ADU29606.1 3-hydroxyisobutyrate dehydrogenase [Evansella cellulosilytica DSM 2522]
MSIKRVGFIGLGAMGLPMAKNLLKSGYELHVAAHRNKQPVEQLKSEGAIEHTSLVELVSNSDVLISILPTDKEMESVLLSDDVLSNLSKENVLVEMTSGSPEMMKNVHAVYQKKGIRVIDAPVSGGTAGAQQGTLTIMAGGEEAVLDEVRPVLDAMAKQIYLVGAIGAGKAIKAINQMLAGIHMIASGEAVALAEKLEIDKEMVKQVIGNSSGASWMLMNKIDSLTERNYEPGFKLNLMKKDIQIAVNEAKDMNLPFASNALQMFKDKEGESGELDFSAISKDILS